VCAHWKLKVRSKDIELVRSNGRVTDTSSPETNLASHLTSCAWRLEQVSKLLAAPVPERESSRTCPLRQWCRIMVRYARTIGLATSEAVTGDREDACSISAVGDNGVSSPAAAEMM
jgi:hypothetical protein